MDTIFQSLLILMAAVWIVAIALRRFGVPTAISELIVGIVVGPMLFGWSEPGHQSPGGNRNLPYDASRRRTNRTPRVSVGTAAGLAVSARLGNGRD